MCVTCISHIYIMHMYVYMCTCNMYMYSICMHMWTPPRGTKEERNEGREVIKERVKEGRKATKEGRKERTNERRNGIKERRVSGKGLYEYIYIYIYVCVCVCVCVYMYICIYTHIYRTKKTRQSLLHAENCTHSLLLHPVFFKTKQNKNKITWNKKLSKQNKNKKTNAENLVCTQKIARIPSFSILVLQVCIPYVGFEV